MTKTHAEFPRATLVKRLAAMTYDVLVAVAVAMCAGMLITVILIILLEHGVLDMQGKVHTTEVIQTSTLYSYVIQTWVLLWVTGFFLWFWKHGGQTIGMRAWRLKIQSTNEHPIGYPRALLRMVTSLGGISTLWIICNPKKKLGLQDIASGTEIVQLNKHANHHRNWKGL